jgi:hypothetical protein
MRLAFRKAALLAAVRLPCGIPPGRIHIAEAVWQFATNLFPAAWAVL